MLSQSAYIFAAKIIGYGIRILLPAFLVRVLTKADFGSYNQFFLIEILFQTIFQMGVNQSQFFFIPRDPKNAGSYFLSSISLNIGLFLVAYSVIAVFRFPIAEFLKMPILTDLFWYLAAYTLVLMLTVCSASYLMARKFFKQAAVVEVATQIVVSIATIVAAYLTRDLRIIIAALLAARLVSLVAVMAFIHLKLNGFASERYFFGLGKQVRYGVVLGLAAMLWTIQMRMHELSVSKFFGLEQYAVYAAGCKRIPILLFFTQSITPVALVRFAQLEAENNWQGIKELWEKILGTMYGFGIPLTVFFVLVARPLVTLMFTSEYEGAILVFQINTIASLYQLLNPARILRAMDRNDITIKVHAVILVLMPFALYAGKSVAGIYGIIGAHAIMAILVRVAILFVLNRIAPVSLPYLPSRSSVWIFYRDSFLKVRSLLWRRTA